MSAFSHHVLLYLRTLYMYIVWSLVRRRVTRRLTGLQTMHNVLKIAKHFKTVAVRLRLIFQFTYVQYCTWCQLCCVCFSWSRVMHYILEINEPMSSHRMLNPESKVGHGTTPIVRSHSEILLLCDPSHRKRDLMLHHAMAIYQWLTYRNTT